MNVAISPELAEQAAEAIAPAMRYVLNRRTAGGGFCFYRCEHLEEPNLQDTYYAVTALTLLSGCRRHAEVAIEFLTAFDATEPNALYYAVFALDLLGQGVLVEQRYAARVREWPLPSVPDSTDAVTSGWLESTLKLLRLKQRFAELNAARELERFIASLCYDGGYGAKPNLVDTCLCLRILDLLAVRANKDATRAFLDRLQIPVLGFTATGDSMLTSLEVIDAGIRCCSMLNTPVRHAADALAFTLACQSVDGGFARTGGALPDLEQTSRALRIVHVLQPALSVWE
jgi:hypothetical protein